MLALALAVHAATVYKTVDANGVVSYSDTPPADNRQVETLEIAAPAPQLTETEQQRLEAMRETTDRMVADRQQREKHRADLRQGQVQDTPQYRQRDYPDYSGYSDTYPVYYPYPVHRPGRPRPGHPIARPPLRPVPPGQRPGLQPISPGHDYPASLVRRHYSPAVRAAFEK